MKTKQKATSRRALPAPAATFNESYERLATAIRAYRTLGYLLCSVDDAPSPNELFSLFEVLDRESACALAEFKPYRFPSIEGGAK